MSSLALPDIAAQSSQQALPLDWVGMCGIALPLLVDGRSLGAHADAGVSLDDGAAGASICHGCTWRWKRWNSER